MSATRQELVERILDVFLFKTGLLLTEVELRDHVGAEWDRLIAGDPHATVSLRAEEYEHLVRRALFELGHEQEAPTATTKIDHEALDALLKRAGGPDKKTIVDAIDDLAFENVKRAALSAPGQPIDPMPVIRKARERFGLAGAALAMEWYERTVAHVRGSPWSKMRRVEWKDDAALVDLFKSANLATPHGTFFDQRYIDYLAAQFDGAIDRIHWRKFEGLTCEYFVRQGRRVQIGPGTNDGNVDARVWWPDDEPGAPAALLIQCKREAETVGKLVVKALYADVKSENASAGLIVTTQRLSRGAEALRVAREYPIEQADRTDLREWLASMRSKP